MLVPIPTRIVRGSENSPAIALSENKDIFRSISLFKKLMAGNNPDVNSNVYTKFCKFCQFILKILSKNQILTSIKGCNSVANLQKMTLYNTNVDLVNDNVYTKFG